MYLNNYPNGHGSQLHIHAWNHQIRAKNICLQSHWYKQHPPHSDRRQNQLQAHKSSNPIYFHFSISTVRRQILFP